MGDDALARLAVRVATFENARDIDDLARLRHEWRVGERDEEGLALDEFRLVLAEWMAESASSHWPFIGSIDNTAVAMAWLAIVQRVPGPAHVRRTCAYVQSVYVTPVWRDAGVGSVLVRHLVETGREIGLDYIAVHPSERSFPFYRRLGFAGTECVLELDFRPNRRAT